MRTVLVVALVGALVLADGASADVCRYVPPKSERQVRIENAVSARAIWGLPRGRALVERLDRDRAARRRGYAILDFPMTVPEARYFRDRARVGDVEYGSVAGVARRSPGFSGGISVEDDYPRGAFVLLRVTRRPRRAELRALHRAARRLRLRRVRYSERALRRLQDRIRPTDAEKQGVVLWGLGVSLDRNAVEITYSSQRPDAQAVLHRLYGPALTFEQVPAWTPTCSDPTSYTLESDERTMRLGWGDSGSATNPRVEIQELNDRVLVGGVDDLPPFVTADLSLRQATVTLAVPLGARPLISAVTHKSVPRRGKPTLR